MDRHPNETDATFGNSLSFSKIRMDSSLRLHHLLLAVDSIQMHVRGRRPNRCRLQIPKHTRGVDRARRNARRPALQSYGRPGQHFPEAHDLRQVISCVGPSDPAGRVAGRENSHKCT